MARPKNLQAKEHIKEAAFRLLLKRGFNDTTYREIADTSNNTRSTVQYYYPNKELLAVELVDRILSLTIDFMIEEHGSDLNGHAYLYLSGQYYISFIVSCTELRSFFLDVINSRDLTEEIINLDSKNARETLGLPEDTKPLYSTRIILIMGGLYELLFRSVKKRTKFDVVSVMKNLYSEYFKITVPIEDEDNLFAKYAVSDEELENSNEVLYERLKTSLGIKG